MFVRVCYIQMKRYVHLIARCNVYAISKDYSSPFAFLIFNATSV